jgi:hypothetical protein
MAEYKVSRRAIGAHAKTLEPDTVDTVVFTDDLRQIEVVSDGAAEIYFTVDRDAPEVGDEFAYFLPAVPSSRIVKAPEGVRQGTQVHLISPGEPNYSVAKA